MSRQTAKRAEPIAHCHVFIDRPLPIRRRRAFGDTGILRSPINSNCLPLSQPERNSRYGVVGEEPESSPYGRLGTATGPPPFFLRDPTPLRNEGPIVDPTAEITTGSACLVLIYQSPALSL
ncbi:hypothetical protein U1Q18_025957 [Sarracenia purpurea var. burkii]